MSGQRLGRNMAAALAALHRQEPLWAGEMGRRIDRTHTVAADVLRRLHARGWVSSAMHGHRRMYRLNDAGRAAWAAHSAPPARAPRMPAPPAGATGAPVHMSRNIHLTMKALENARAVRPVYGWWLVQHLGRGTSAVYNMLRMLEERGWVTSQWEVGRPGPQRRYYWATAYGRAAWAQAQQRKHSRGRPAYLDE